MSLTVKQHQIMQVIFEANPVPDRGPVDLDQLLERVPYQTTKASMQFSLRALIKKGLIEKTGSENRRGRRRTLIKVTAAGGDLFSAGSSPQIEAPEGFSLTPEGSFTAFLDDLKNIEENQSLMTSIFKMD